MHTGNGEILSPAVKGRNAVILLGHACLDYPAAVRCVVSFSHGKTSFRLPHGCGGISGVSRMAGFGEGTPQQDSRRGKMSDKRILVLR